MNKHYQKALVEAVKEELNINISDEEIIEVIENYEYDLKELDFEEAVQSLWETIMEEYAEEDEEETPEEQINSIVDNLHVGFNFVPGVGFGYCSDEADLERMKDFVRGGVAVQTMMNLL